MAGKILVLGATGNVGTPLVTELVARGESVHAASRSGKPVAGAEGVALDYADADSIAAALDGIDRAYVLVPAGQVDVPGLLRPFLDAAQAREVKLVLQSVFGVDAAPDSPYRQVELQLEGAGLPYVILRPNWFADNFHRYWIEGVKAGVIAVPAAEGKTSFIDARDIADAAAAALTSHRFDGQAFNLTGPEALGYADAAQLLSDVVGHPVRYQAIDTPAFIDGLVGHGVPRAYAELLATIFEPVAAGYTAVVTGDVQALTGHPPRALASYARDHASQLRGQGAQAA